MTDHVHPEGEACGSTPETDQLLARLNDPTNKLTERQFRELRGRFFTIRHIPVPQCGHKIDALNEPSIGCEQCWWSWFTMHGDLVKTTDEAFREHGREFIIKLRGKRYLKYFLRYMSTLAAFKLEADALQKDSNEITRLDGEDLRSVDSNQPREEQPCE